jgi:hypothetical protein
MNVYLVEHGFFDDCGFVAYTWKYESTKPKVLFRTKDEAITYIKETFPNFVEDLTYEETGSQLYVLYEGARASRGVLLTPLEL